MCDLIQSKCLSKDYTTDLLTKLPGYPGIGICSIRRWLSSGMEVGVGVGCMPIPSTPALPEVRCGLR